MNIPEIRTYSQQLFQQQFDTPQKLVSWFGAMQAQNFAMSKWAIGIRQNNSTLTDIEAALTRGEILRTHAMRPTWHLVAAEDIRWLCELSKKTIVSAQKGGEKRLEIDEKLFSKVNNLIVKMLENNNHLTREEVANNLNINGIETNSWRMVYFMMRAEAEGLICSGIDKGKKQTYALIDERVKPTKKLNKNEALARLAQKYFQSHSPATLNDFSWWSGLLLSDCRNAVKMIENELIEEKRGDKTYYIHQSSNTNVPLTENLHFLPAFDEYIIAYRYRETVLAAEHQPKAFTKNGIFFPTILYNGKIVGTWDKKLKGNNLEISHSFFENDFPVSKSVLEKTEKRYKKFFENA